MKILLLLCGRAPYLYFFWTISAERKSGEGLSGDS
jgi:hypothetical protein